MSCRKLLPQNLPEQMDLDDGRQDIVMQACSYRQSLVSPLLHELSGCAFQRRALSTYPLFGAVQPLPGGKSLSSEHERRGKEQDSPNPDGDVDLSQQ